MRKIFLASAFLTSCLFVSAIFAQTTAQTTAPAAPPTQGWERVEALQTGTKLHVKTLANGKTDCVFANANADSLTCGGTVFQRASIKSVKTAHRLRSTVVGFAVGYGAATAVTAIAAAKTGNCNSFFGCNSRCDSAGCLAALGIVDLGLLVATPILFHVYDLTGSTIYKVE